MCDTHGKNFKIAAHIRDAEAEQLLQYRLRAEAAPSLVTAFASQQQQQSANNAQQQQQQQQQQLLLHQQASLSTSAETLRDSQFFNEAHRVSAPFDRYSVSQLALERVHNRAWKEAALNDRRWYEAHDAHATRKYTAGLSQFDADNDNAQSAGATASSSSHSSVAGVVNAAGVVDTSIPATSKLGKVRATKRFIVARWFRLFTPIGNRS